VGLETRIFKNGTASFGRTGPTGQRGPLLEVDHFFRKFPSGPKRSIYVSTKISGNFGSMESTLYDSHGAIQFYQLKKDE